MMKHKYEQTDLNRARGRPFTMAYVYMRHGTHLYTGDLETIHEHLRPVSTCHGSVVTYIPRMKKPMFSVEIFGKGGFINNKDQKNYLSFEHMSLLDYHSYKYRELINFLENRKKFLLVENTLNGLYSLGSWRRLPKVYLPIFKEYDESMPILQIEVPIWHRATKIK